MSRTPRLPRTSTGTGTGTGTRTRRVATALAAVALLAPLAACGGSDDDEDDSGSGAKGGGKTELTVLAAASLTDVFETAGDAYEKEHPGTTLRFSFEGSQELAAKVRQGAPADALVTADTKTMDDLSGETGEPTVIAKNRLVIAVGKGNPKKVEALDDLDASGLKVVLAASEVPVGRYSKEVLDARKVAVKPVSQEPNVRAVLSKVQLGEADAGLVYKTDVTAAKGKAEGVDIPDDQNALASYPAAALKGSKHGDEAGEFVEWLSSAAAQKILRDAGFQQP
ncbi:molybdate ABC transporter substrate-binding protein [Streptomyces sp. Z26]|uniref:molybdate ABC transporter substrate-binding protein n=1 Tax=Streptomyces sp. Z26 TaxID=2500177 RepID=UPI000EF14F0D|nr:molybdate ABC transporter substrate-binding protein [Streptomyces sp. Z26]RLL68077.1 molybdate ABC transporter substrate-binding protein [Streptomyces sp. Z26]